MVEAGVGKDGQGAHGGEDDKDPQEHAVHHHGNVLPVLLQLRRTGGQQGAQREGKSEMKIENQ